ncbi:MAG: Na+/H+ antiporter [Phycisphaerales bacterium]|nr:Na+/H+ antiporter [Phycisphaerales bacterium]
MHVIELVLSLFVAVAAMAYFASRARVPYPIFLVVGGLALGFIPNLPRVTLDPDVVFVLFLPPILYHAGIMTSWRDFKANGRAIGLLAIGLVLFTTALVAVAAHYLMGMSWATGFVLGAVISPPDAVAATAIMSKMRIPRRIITILEGESLVNDATALVAYQLAVLAVARGHFSMADGALRFIWVSVGGVGIGLLAGLIIAWVRPRLRHDGIEGLVSLLTPYIAYLPAERLGVSGVLAAVVAGIYMSRRLPAILASHTRLRLYAVWDALIFLLNGLVFILIGLQLPFVLEHLCATRTDHLIRHALLICLIVIVLRMVWVFAATYLPRRMFKSAREADPAPPRASVFVIAWTGLRGIVSLAAALALPLTLADGVTPFPHRDLIIFVTFAVILVTLVVQGLSLPLIIRVLKLSDDGSDHREEMRARYEAVHAAISRLDALVLLGEATPEAVERVKADLASQARWLRGQISGEMDDGEETICATHEAAQRESLIAQNQMVIKLRDDGIIGDEVLRRVQAELDLEGARLWAE